MSHKQFKASLTQLVISAGVGCYGEYLQVVDSPGWLRGHLSDLAAPMLCASATKVLYETSTPTIQHTAIGYAINFTLVEFVGKFAPNVGYFDAQDIACYAAGAAVTVLLNNFLDKKRESSLEAKLLASSHDGN